MPVSAVTVIKAPIQDETSFLGELRSMHTVDLRPQVEGTITKLLFKEGENVEKGQKLFRIDDRPIKARLAKAKADLAKAKAQAEKTKADLGRAEKLKAEEAISQRDYQQFKASSDGAAAEVKAAQAAIQSANVDLGYTTLSAPISGTIGLASAKVGNLVGPKSEQPLARITQLDPIHLYVSASERFYLSAKRAQQERKKKGEDVSYELRLKLADGSIYEHHGELDYISHELDTKTGTFEIRAAFPNPDRLLLPGQYGELLASNARPVERLLIPRKSIIKRQAGAFVFVVANDGVVESRKVELGSIHGTLQVVAEGVEEGDRVVVDGLQKIRDGSKVDAKELPPPTPPAPPPEPEEQAEPEPEPEPAEDSKAKKKKTKKTKKNKSKRGKKN